MFCLNQNIFFFLKNINFLNLNLLYLSNYNTLIFLFFNNNKKIKKLEKRVDYKKNIDFKTINIFLLKYFKFANSLQIKPLNYFNIDNTHRYKVGNMNLFVINNNNITNLKRLSNIIIDLTINNYNFIVFDKSYNTITPIYNYLYGFKNLFIYKKFFFFDYKKFTYTSWIYLYEYFLNIFNIKFLIMLEYQFFYKYIKTVRKIHLPITSLIPINGSDNFIDYPVFYTNKINQIEKFIFLNYLTTCLFISINFNNYLKKIKFLKVFYKFSNIL